MPDHDIEAWQSGGPYVFSRVAVTINGNICTMELSAGPYHRVIQMTKATARDLHRMLGLRFDDTTDDEQQKRAW